MCGIAGLFQYESSPATADPSELKATVARMVDCLEHRGPDGEGLLEIAQLTERVVLGHRRLSILDLTPAGRQPMSDPLTGNSISYNGEVYNYRELRSLNPGPWSSNTDAEVILKGYGRWGRGVLHRLRGMFAFAVWDAREQKLFVARDRLGVKPLYYFSGDGFFLLASEVRALLASGWVPRAVDTTVLVDYLAYQSVPAPRTLIQGVGCLRPGTWLTVDKTGATEEGCYWDLLESVGSVGEPTSAKEVRNRVKELLAESVAVHLLSDVPVGAFLSGGIDSSTVVALIREAGSVPLTFSVVFSEEAFNEARYSRQVAERFRTEHTELHLTETDLLDQLPEALAAMDQPTGDGVNTYVISKQVHSRGIKVALSGLGGDEFFGGYPSFARLTRMMPWLRLWGNLPLALRGKVAKAVEILGGASIPSTKLAGLLQARGRLASLYPLTRQVLSRPQRQALLSEDRWGAIAPDADPYERMLGKALEHGAPVGTMSQISYAEASTYMHDVLLRDTDQMGMAHSLEIRVPLLDHKLVEYLMSLPDSYKYPNGTPKRLLVESVGDLLPDGVIHRPKQGFVLPFGLWMRGALRGFCEERLRPDRVEAQGVLRPRQVQHLWESFLQGRRNASWSRLWVLVVLSEWMERNGVMLRG